MAPIHLSTILTRSPMQLVNQLAQLSSQYGGKGHTVFFALSSNFPRPEDLQDAVNMLTMFNDIASPYESGRLPRKGKERASGHTLGCLTDTFSSVSFQSIDEKSRKSNSGYYEAPLLSCAIGIFNSEHCIPFRSTLAGREQPQVGRWHAFRKQGNEGVSSGSGEDESASVDWEGMKDAGKGEVNWEEIWSRSEAPNPSSTSLSSATLSSLPESLRNIDPSKIQTLLTLSSPHPDALMSAFSEYLSLPKHTTPSTSLTLVAAPTHFITGRGVTLFMNGEIFGDGAIGLAFLRNDTRDRDPAYKTEFLGIKKLSGPMTITSREGNMINSLEDPNFNAPDNPNPTRLLLDALDYAGMGATQSSPHLASSFKDSEQFALGVLTPSGEISRTYKITAGDPLSRGGSLSLDAPRAPEVNTVVQFLHCPSNTSLTMPSSLVATSGSKSSTKQVLGFLTVPEPASTRDMTGSEHEFEVPTETRALDNVFLAPSTQGFIAQSLLEPSWPCSLPGGMVLLEWP